MKRLLMASVCIVGLSGVTQAGDLTQVEAQNIYKGVQDQFTESFKNKQVDKMVALFNDDGWRVTDMGPVVGKDALQKHWEAVYKIADLENSYPDHVKVLDNNHILATGRWEATLRIPNQPAMPATGFWVVEIDKQKDNTWKIAMEGYNVKMPPPPAAKTQ
jgi:ketosteroid isomerase-like protein